MTKMIALSDSLYEKLKKIKEEKEISFSKAINDLINEEALIKMLKDHEDRLNKLEEFIERHSVG